MLANNDVMSSHPGARIHLQTTDKHMLIAIALRNVVGFGPIGRICAWVVYPRTSRISSTTLSYLMQYSAGQCIHPIRNTMMVPSVDISSSYPCDLSYPLALMLAMIGPRIEHNLKSRIISSASLLRRRNPFQ